MFGVNFLSSASLIISVTMILTKPNKCAWKKNPVFLCAVSSFVDNIDKLKHCTVVYCN